MKKWLVGCLLCSSLFIGNPSIYADAGQESSSAQTEVAVKLTRPIVSDTDQLPGANGGSNANSNKNPNQVNGSSNSGVISNQISIAKPDTSLGKNLPKTNNEQSPLIYSILGGILIGSVACFIIFRKKKEREVEE
ncbi:TPA: LPXTG cell wall anchor domain-containing protein [Enterococcus faecium]